MKLIDLIRLGHKHISAHKRQSVLAVLTIGLLFGAVMGLTFLFEGLENLFIHASDLISGNKIYVTASSCSNGGACLEWDDISSLASKKASAYGGSVVGKMSYYEYKNGGKSFYVLDEKFVENLVEIDLGEYETGTLFKLISLDDADRLINGAPEDFYTVQKTYSLAEISELKEKVLGKEFKETYSVPLAAETDASVSLSDSLDTLAADSADPESPSSALPASIPDVTEYETKELSYVVAGIIGTSKTPLSLSTKYGEVHLLDFFLSRVNRQVSSAAEAFVSLGSSTDYDTIFETAKSASSSVKVSDFSVPIIEFSSLADAYDFYKTENCALDRNYGKCSSFTVTELVGNRLQSKDALDTLYIILNYAGAMLLLIAVTISVFTFMRLIAENAQSVALYRSLGASTFDIFFIYLSYLFELCLITVVFATLLGAAVAAVISLKNAESLSAIMTSIYSRSIDSGVLIGVGQEVLLIFAAILATAPLCSILTVDQLSTKNIAKRIREN